MWVELPVGIFLPRGQSLVSEGTQAEASWPSSGRMQVLMPLLEPLNQSMAISIIWANNFLLLIKPVWVGLLSMELYQTMLTILLLQ
jgi:hypothetical protein